MYFFIQSDQQSLAEAAEKKKKRTFRKYTYRGVDLDHLLDMSKYVTCYFNFVVSDDYLMLL